MWDEISSRGFSLSRAFMALFGDSKCDLSQLSPPTPCFPPLQSSIPLRWSFGIQFLGDLVMETFLAQQLRATMESLSSLWGQSKLI